jgi:hypothetical protein
MILSYMKSHPESSAAQSTEDPQIAALPRRRTDQNEPSVLAGQDALLGHSEHGLVDRLLRPRCAASCQRGVDVCRGSDQPAAVSLHDREHCLTTGHGHEPVLPQLDSRPMDGHASFSLWRRHHQVGGCPARSRTRIALLGGANRSTRLPLFCVLRRDSKQMGTLQRRVVGWSSKDASAFENRVEATVSGHQHKLGRQATEVGPGPCAAD